MVYAICLGLFLPLAGFIILMTTSSWIGRRLSGFIACATVLVSFISFASLLIAYENGQLSQQSITLYSWIPIEGINANFTLRLDALSLLMTLIITGVGFLIHVYSNGYMEHEEDYARFFAFMNFFVFAMLLLVLAGDLLLLFVGWEGVGLASYLLIGFWYTRPAAAQAATKAFVVNRIGDLGFLLGLLLTFHTFGTGDIAEVSRRTAQEFAIGAPIINLLTLLYFIGATGKSAQIPLQTWLPDAMEGPTPVSALIHAATMVTAGVYLVVRLHPVFLHTPQTLYLVGAIGAATSLYAALCAVGQTDLKRVLAYSTVSQLGLMFVACGAGAFYAAMFHLTAHAFIKALLFLSAGNVVHMMHDITDMDKMGGLAKKFPATHWLFLVGVLALAGIPPLAAFFSKELILSQEHLVGYETLYLIAFAASILTAFYLTRAYCLTFTGAPRIADKILKMVKEAPGIMLVPVSLLALLSIIGGILGYSFGGTPILERFLGKVDVGLAVKAANNEYLYTVETLVAVCGAVLAIAAAAIMYTRYVDMFRRPMELLRRSFYIDEIYWGVFAVPLRAFAKFIADVFEPRFIDGIIRGLTKTTQGTSRWMQKLQSGQIRSYVAWMVFGSVLLMIYLVL